MSQLPSLPIYPEKSALLAGESALYPARLRLTKQDNWCWRCFVAVAWSLASGWRRTSASLVEPKVNEIYASREFRGNLEQIAPRTCVTRGSLFLPA